MVEGLMAIDNDWTPVSDYIMYDIEGSKAANEALAAAANNMPTWLQDIEKRAELGKGWRDSLDIHKELAEAGRYIRIQSRTVRAVSLSEANPCGSLRSKETDVEIKATRDIAKAITEARSAKDGIPKRDKPEQRVQAFLIRAAMQNALHLDQVISGCSDTFDELLFVTDEFLVLPGKEQKACQADIVALAGKDGVYFPVFIELKNGHLLSRLMTQLDNAERWLWQCKSARFLLRQFLSAVTGIPMEQIESNENIARKMLIWPKSPTGNESKAVDEARKKGFLIVEFDPAYKFTRIMLRKVEA
jgi:hypothetical protein